MRYPAEQTAKKHEKILNEAARLFRERGFAGISVAEVMKAAGLTHGAFYAHFDSKEALAAEAVARAFAQSDAQIDARVAGAKDPKKAFLDGYLSTAHRDRPGFGCAMAALGPESARDPVLRGAFTENIRRRIAGMAGRFRWKNRKPPRQNALHLLSAAVGALILARLVDDPALSEEFLEGVRDSLTSL